MLSLSHSQSEELYELACRHLVAGVSAAARLNAAIGRPLILSRSDGCRIYDVDGHEYIDYNLSHGASFLGHNHPKVRQAVERALDLGAACAYETAFHGQLAEMICETIPCAELVRFANSGSESTLVALRLARAATGRSKILKFEGHFHGLHEHVMWNAHGPAREELPSYPYVPPLAESAGIPPQFADLIVVVPWNDPAAFLRAMQEHGSEIAAVICEPVNFNSGCILPKPGFLNLLREEATKYGAILIFDEVLSSFRMGPGGVQEYYAVTPDLCTIAKAISNGLPLAVVAGKREVMQHLSPLGGASHSGTYSGHIFAVMAAIASLEEIRSPGFYDQIHAKADSLYGGLTKLFTAHRIPARVQGLGARFGIYFGVTGEIWNYQDAVRIDPELTHQFIRGCFEQGVYFHNYGRLALGHHGFSAAHTIADIDETLDRIDRVLSGIQR